MSSIAGYDRKDIRKDTRAFSASRTTIETAFYGNNVVPLDGLHEAYELARQSPGTIETDMPVKEPEKTGLPPGANVLLFNDGETVGRFAKARVVIGEEGVSEVKMGKVLREAAYNIRNKKMYHSKAYIGLDEDFIIKANLLVPEGFENTAYNWLLNFQYMNEYYDEMYARSKPIEGEPEIFVLSDPDYVHPNYPEGLALFDPEHNCACLLGLRYFGEHKKGTLTLAWGIANRNGYASCHGGLKKIIRKDSKKFVLGVFGLSGSGKSTLTHAKHGGKYDVTVLHDDAYIISSDDGSAVALEPSYFDKTQDYPVTSPDNKYLLTVQNCGVTIDSGGKKVLVAEDIRNGNGRAIKSKLWASNRVDKMEDPINAVAWLMKDNSLPPIVKIENPVLASVMGACLATKRTTAEKLAEGVDPNMLVFEPYANPFRTYPLSEDYLKFKYLFEERGVDCYIINTGTFRGKDIPKEVTISILEAVIDGTAEFVDFGTLDEIRMMEVDGFETDFSDQAYTLLLKKQMESRMEFIHSRDEEKSGRDALPIEAIEELWKVAAKLVTPLPAREKTANPVNART
ncbi:MAG: phosphoenolpyruvate carboxykinase (ATP) [Clostridiales Family XIII bacterium]|nr:phosphoenolpyruvate carboxykinase (ATP) [Clostridiales Family XIII bacterium]